MIGLDTNILLRAYMDDDRVQSPRARLIMDGLSQQSRGLINLVVLSEFCWTLRSGYKIGPREVIDIVDEMLASPDLVVDQASAVSAAVVLARAFGLEFGDALIAALNSAAGCSETFTFDKTAAKAPGFALVS